MGLPIIGLVVKLVGGGIGLVQEVKAERAARREQYSSRTLASSNSPRSPVAPRSPPAASTSKAIEANASESSRDAVEQPPPPYSEQYVEVGPEQAEELIASGNAQPVGTVVYRSSMDKAEVADEDSADDEEDEREWALDDFAGQQTTESPDISRTTSPSSGILSNKRGLDGQLTLASYASNVLATCPPPLGTPKRLDQPIIVPQRRPGEKARGFVRAYAPVLADSGISQETFLSFIKNFQGASSASPVLNVVFFSAGAAGFVPEPFTQLGSAAVQIAAGAAMEVQRRKRTNNFLDQMNEQLFKPRGLYAMIMSYVPNAARPIEAESVDITSIIARQTDQSGKLKASLKAHSGRTFVEPELPESAPLIFPGVAEAAQSDDSTRRPSVKTSKILADYFDRRAQAMYAAKHPESGLKVPDHQAPVFASRFSDPNDLGGNSSIIALVTGGKYDPDKKQRQERREKKLQKEAGKRAEDSLRQQNGRKTRRRSMKSKILYLMIVNMPTEHELSVARATMIEAQNRAS